MKKSLSFALSVLVISGGTVFGSDPLVAQTSPPQDQWDLTEAQWRSGTDLELARASEIFMRCNKVKGISATSDARSHLILSIAYRHGICFDKDKAQAEKWVFSAAKSGDARAVLEQAAIISERATTPAELKAVFDMVQRAADKGDFRAKAALAAAYADGVGDYIKADSGKSIALMRESIRGGYWPMLLLYTGELFKNQPMDTAPDKLTAAEIAAAWKQAAENYNYSAMAAYASALEKGEGVTPNATEAKLWRDKIATRGDQTNDAEIEDAWRVIAIQWKIPETDQQRLARLEAAAAKDNPQSLYELGSLLEYGGDSVAADLPRAIALYKRAANLGNSLALGAVNIYLFDPESPHYDEVEGIRLLRQQIQNDPANAMEARKALANQLGYTKTVRRDLKTAMTLMREVAASGDNYAALNLAEMLVPKADDDEATAALRDATKAAALYEQFLNSTDGNADLESMANLADLYRNQYVENVDAESKIAHWIMKSANGGSATGNLYLGDYYFYGDIPQSPDIVKAKQYWNTALELAPDWKLTDRFAMADSMLSEDKTTVTAAQMVALGKKYEDGSERPRILDKARYWLERGIDAGSNDRDALWRLATMYDLDGPAGKSEALWRRLAIGSDDMAPDARARVAEFDAARAAARPVVKVTTPRPAPRPTATTTIKTPVAAPSIGKPWGNVKVPIGKPLICEMKIWSGMKSFGIVSRESKPRYDDAFRLEFLSRTQVRITGSDSLKNGVRSIVVQGSIAKISDPYQVSNGLLGIKHWNVQPFEFDLDQYTFEEIWDSSWDGRTIKKGNCE